MVQTMALPVARAVRLYCTSLSREAGIRFPNAAGAYGPFV